MHAGGYDNPQGTGLNATGLPVPIGIFGVIAEPRPGLVLCGIDDPLKPIDSVA